ncbi:MAG: DNA methylase, partial [Bacteroidales bacterium]|nr:DNA methylase [Bacteroidales bacterium]
MECGFIVPLIPSLVIGRKTNTVALLREQDGYFDIDIQMNASETDMMTAENGTIIDNNLVCPHCKKSTPMATIKHDLKNDAGSTEYGLRQWSKEDFVPKPTDVFQERLYCIKYIRPDGSWYHRTPNKFDLANEEKVTQIIAENFTSWQENGFIPTMAIESGYNTEQIIREKGWRYWHQLFTPRQLLTTSLFIQESVKLSQSKEELVASLLGVNRMLNWNSKLSRWSPAAAHECGLDTFYNQALNTFFNYSTRAIYALNATWYFSINNYPINVKDTVNACDARECALDCDFWITDPPYADAVNYHELSEFFLAWDKRLLKDSFPEWYADSKRVLAVRGDDHFSHIMIEIYTNLANHMPNNGMQVIMFTHSDPAVWAQLALIMWKSGLRVTAAWNIATETDASGIKDGNYVKGTVLLVLRKQTGEEMAFLDEINSDIRSEVRKQIASMLELENKEEPNFSDPDFVLAAYAASLKVLTSYMTIEDLDLDYELNLAINNPSQSSVVKIIETAKKIAYDCVIPLEFESYLWKDLSNAEKFYIKGLESEKHGNYQISTYQEFARGFNIGGYSQMMASEKANTARLKTPIEMAGRTINEVPDFEKSLLRTVFMGIFTGIKEDENPSKALGYIK